MAQEDINSDKLGEPLGDASADSTRLKKLARRRLIGAVALALFAAIVLPMVMDHQPAPPLRDIQVRIPNPDEGAPQRIAPKPIVIAPPREDKPVPVPVAEPVPVAKSVEKEEIKPIAKMETKPETKQEAKPEIKPEAKPEPVKTNSAKVEAALPASDAARAQNVLSGNTAGEAWEVQLGAYQEPGRVKLLLTKLKELGIPTYTEKVDTPNGPRTRVRAGPYASQEAAEKARTRVKIVGVDGPVAKKP